MSALSRFPLAEGLQRDVVYLGSLIAPSYMSPNAGEGLSQWVQLCTRDQIIFGDLTSYFTYATWGQWHNSSTDFNIKHNGSKLPVHFTTYSGPLYSKITAVLISVEIGLNWTSRGPFFQLAGSVLRAWKSPQTESACRIPNFFLKIFVSG